MSQSQAKGRAKEKRRRRSVIRREGRESERGEAWERGRRRAKSRTLFATRSLQAGLYRFCLDVLYYAAEDTTDDAGNKQESARGGGGGGGGRGLGARTAAVCAVARPRRPPPLLWGGGGEKEKGKTSKNLLSAGGGAFTSACKDCRGCAGGGGGAAAPWRVLKGGGGTGGRGAKSGTRKSEGGTRKTKKRVLLRFKEEGRRCRRPAAGCSTGRPPSSTRSCQRTSPHQKRPRSGSLGWWSAIRTRCTLLQACRRSSFGTGRSCRRPRCTSRRRLASTSWISSRTRIRRDKSGWALLDRAASTSSTGMRTPSPSTGSRWRTRRYSWQRSRSQGKGRCTRCFQQGRSSLRGKQRTASRRQSATSGRCLRGSGSPHGRRSPTGADS
jgi:hypothetical protein